MTPVIENILKSKSIMTYLESKGHTPVRSMSAGRYSFRCPFPDHNETKPSFMVWTNAQYENFYCFGCQRNNNIIHLVSFIEGISFKQAIDKLADGFVVTHEEEAEFALQQLNKRIQEGTDNPLYFEHRKLEDSLIEMSNLCLAYLSGVEYNQEEIDIINKFWANIDKELIDINFDKIEESLIHLPDTLYNRRQKIEEQREVLSYDRVL